LIFLRLAAARSLTERLLKRPCMGLEE